MKIFATKRIFIIKFIAIALCGFVFSIITIIPLRIAIARYQVPSPQAILTLGGGHEREVFTAQFALNHPDLPIWVSSGSKEMRAREIFQEIGINNHRVYIDRRATDTVTNFTTLTKDFQQQKIRHIYLITSDFHLPRSKAIASIVLGSRGITYTPISITTDRLTEPRYKTIRDVIRSFFWLLTSHTGSSLSQRSSHELFK